MSLDDRSLFDDGTCAWGPQYTSDAGRFGMRYCGTCWIAIVAETCPDCGAPTSEDAPSGWKQTPIQSNFTDELRTALGIVLTAPVHVDPDDYGEWWD